MKLNANRFSTADVEPVRYGWDDLRQLQQTTWQVCNDSKLMHDAVHSAMTWIYCFLTVCNDYGLTMIRPSAKTINHSIHSIPYYLTRSHTDCTLLCMEITDRLGHIRDQQKQHSMDVNRIFSHVIDCSRLFSASLRLLQTRKTEVRSGRTGNYKQLLTSPQHL